MNISKVSFYGNLADCKIEQNRLVIGNQAYVRGDKVALTNKSRPGIVVPAEIKDFNISPRQENILLIYKDLNTDKFEHVGTVSPKNYDIYNRNEVRQIIREKVDEIYEWKAAAAEIAPQKYH